MIRILIIIVVALSLIWSGYWFLGGRAHRGMVVDQLEMAESNGWKITHSGVELNGFPNRFDTTIADLRMESPEGEFIWEAPSLQLLTLSYRPNHLIAVLPDEQRFLILGNSVDLISQGMNASIVVSDPDSLNIERFIFESSQAELKSQTGWKAAFESVVFAVRRSDQDPAKIDAAIRLSSRDVRSGEIEADDTEESTKPMTVTGEASLHASRELGLNMCKDGYAEIQRIDISEFKLSRNQSEIGVAGSLVFDSLGVSGGQLDITLTNGQLLVEEAAEADLINRDVAANIGTVLSLFALTSADPASATAPISIRNGRVRFAGIGLYDLPRLPPICD